MPAVRKARVRTAWRYPPPQDYLAHHVLQGRYHGADADLPTRMQGLPFDRFEFVPADGEDGWQARLQANLAAAGAVEHGCRQLWACSSHAMSMRLDEEGGARPTVQQVKAEPGRHILAALGRVVIKQHLVEQLADAVPEGVCGMELLAGNFQPVWKSSAAGGTEVRGAASMCIPIDGQQFPPFKKDEAEGQGEKHYVRINNWNYAWLYVGSAGSGNSRRELLHRLICTAWHGAPKEYTDGRGYRRWEEVSHTCQHPYCLNPKHMEWSQHAANMRVGRGGAA